MLKELYLYLTTPSKPIAKKSGLLYESIAIGQRAQRQKKNWSEHWSQCHQTIKEQIELLEKKSAGQNTKTQLPSKLKTCCVIGSGYLHEVPIEYLLNQFEKIILVDIVHPKVVREQYAQNHKIELIEYDISQALTLTEKEVMDLKIPQPDFLNNVDVVISANLLSQIPRAFANRMSAKALVKLQKDHISLLQNTQAQLKMIFFDYQINVYDKDQNHDQSETTVPSQLIQNKIKSWKWQYAPIGEIDKNYTFEMDVAFCILT